MIRRLLAVGLLVGLAAGCSPAPTAPPWPDVPGPKVMTSFAPIRCFAENVGGDAVAVRAVMSTAGPHDYQPSRDDALRLTSADLFLINGLGLDDGIATKMSKLGGAAVPLVKLGETIPEAMRLEGGCNHDHGDEGHDHHDHAHGTDPHVWLGPEQAALMVNKIRDEFKERDPARAADYDRRAAEYVAKLQKLHADGLALLRGKTERQFVSFHGSMNYFTRAFGLADSEVIQDVPGIEPSPKQMKALAERCGAKKLRVIAVEPQYSAGTSARVIADELRARGVADPVVIVLDPLETAPDSEFGPGWYEARMRANLDALAKALR